MRNMIAVLALSLLAAPAFAQMGGGGMGGGMGGGGGGMGGHRHGGGQGDGTGSQGNGGGYHQPRPIKPVKWSEFEAKVRADFAAADLDHNGVVTIDEVHAARDAKLKKLVDERFAMVDTNHDGTISHDEFAAWQIHMGDPDAADRKLASEDRQQIVEASDKPFRRGHGDEDEIAGGLLAPVDEVLIVNADTNNDVALSLAEDLAYQKARFDAADTDHDGTLSEDEIRAARQKMRSQA